MKKQLVLLACVLLFVGCSSESIESDPEAVSRGKVLAKDCTACHSLTGKHNKIGPFLQGVYGRRAGVASKYAYSEAMKNADFDWTEDRLVDFIREPSKIVPGTKMAYGSLTEEQAKDIVEFLKSI